MTTGLTETIAAPQEIHPVLRWQETERLSENPTEAAPTPPIGQAIQIDSDADFGSRISTTPSVQQTQIEGWQVTELVLGSRITNKAKSTEVNTRFQWESAGMPLLFIQYEPHRPSRPEPDIDQSVAYMYTDRVKDTLNRLLPLLERTARRSYIQVSKVEVSGFVDPDDESDEVVVTQWVNAPTHVALNYWDKLGLVIETWIKSLPDELARVANERIAVDVQWQQL